MGAVDFWSRHLAACQAQGVSINAYAKREGLSAVSLYYWRKRLGLAGPGPVMWLQVRLCRSRLSAQVIALAVVS